MGGGPAADVNTSELYEVLGLEKDCSKGDIRKAYMKLARKEHPDKGGDPEKFKKISKAYEILGDEEKRKLYDEGGEEAVDSGGGPGASDIFSSMFGGGGGRGRRGPRKGEDITHALKVSLEDLYNGRTFKLKVTRDTLCSGCSGSGCIAGAKEEDCESCDGRGVKIQIRRMGPMIQQMQAPCEECRQSGKKIAPGDRCKECSGKKVQQEKKVLEVGIEKGMKHNDKITFRGQADEAPGMEAGDLVFVVQEKKHDVFVRKGTDLVLEKKITLLEALTGVRFLVDHLDKHQVLVTSGPGEVIASGDLKAVVGSGMPLRGNPFSKGDLFVKFEVVFPKANEITPAQAELLARALPAPTEAVPAVDEDVEEALLSEIDVEAVKARARMQRDAYESDEEDGRGGQRVQCAQQ